MHQHIRQERVRPEVGLYRRPTNGAHLCVAEHINLGRARARRPDCPSWSDKSHCARASVAAGSCSFCVIESLWADGRSFKVGQLLSSSGSQASRARLKWPAKPLKQQAAKRLKVRPHNKLRSPSAPENTRHCDNLLQLSSAVILKWPLARSFIFT